MKEGEAMKRVVIFGAGEFGRMLYSQIKNTQNVLFFVDNNYKNISGQPIKILPPSALKEEDYDLVYIAIASASGLESIYKQLTEDLGIPLKKINRLFSENWADDQTFKKICLPVRLKFLEYFALYTYTHNIEGSAAEVGVNQGDFAKEINRVFPDRRLYLFDTFEGFDERDLNIEAKKNQDSHFMNWLVGSNYFRNNNVEFTRAKLPHPEQCVIKKGYFPETFDLEKEQFAFVHLDTDLYQPTLAGLEIFYPLMSPGGVILVHDYFNGLSGVTKAVDEFTGKNKINAIPIGDQYSAAIVKN